MITYINSDNAKKYTALFENATKDLANLGIEEPITLEDGSQTTQAPTISTIEQYFYYLPKLIEIGSNGDTDYKKLHAKGRRYTILPLDEEFFEIDANTRTISIPKSFSSNGIGVQGDQLAEVIYFKIDRYFDAKDLDDTDIYIQWINADGEKGVSTPFVIDIESEANKLIFGWAIPNVVTKTQGNIQFAVRFYKWVDEDAKKDFSYSLATQTTTIKINSTLDFDFDSESIADLLRTESENQILFTRLENSVTRLTNAQEAAIPVYKLNLTNKYVDLVNGVYTLEVQAYSTDAGKIQYTWHYVDPDGDASKNHSIENTMVYVAIDKTETPVPEIDEIYYYENEESTIDMKAYSAFLGDTFEDDVTYYRQIATCQADKVGKYYATATNYIAGENAQSLDSEITEVPAPIVPKEAKMNHEFIVLGPAEGQKEATIEVEVNNTEDNGTNSGTLSYEWQFDQFSTEEAVFETIENALTNSLTVTYDADHPEEVEGTYKVIVTNTKNGVSKNPENADLLLCHVYYVAEAPELVEQENTIFYLDEVTEDNPLKVEIDSNWIISKPNIASDNTISYQWFTSEDRTTETRDDDVIVEGANENTYIPLTAGKYYCVVTNSKDLGSGEETNEASTISQIYIVNPA